MSKISHNDFFEKALTFIKARQSQELDAFCTLYANKENLSYTPDSYRALIDIATIMDENSFLVLAKHGANIHYKRESQHNFSENLLLIACENYQLKIVQYLLNCGIDVNSIDKIGKNAICYAILDELISHKISLNHLSQTDSLANYLLSDMRNWNNVVYLVSKGLNVDYLDYKRALKYVNGLYQNDPKAHETIKEQIDVAKKYYEKSLLENTLSVKNESSKKIKI